MPGPEKQFAAWLKLRITPELLDWLDRVRGTISRSEWVRRAIEQGLKREERRKAR